MKEYERICLHTETSISVPFKNHSILELQETAGHSAISYRENEAQKDWLSQGPQAVNITADTRIQVRIPNPVSFSARYLHEKNNW